MEELPQLPPEVWVYVFSFLSTEEKHAVRTCCRYLRNLVDHPSLWRDYTVMLSDLRRYTYGFWETLQKRNLTRVAVRHLRRKEWRRLVILLPTLTAIVFMDGGRFYKQKYLDILTRFPNLRDLGVRNAAWNEPMLGRQLTQQHGEMYGLDTVRPVPRSVFHNLLLSLKKLKHLSWGMKGEPLELLPDDYFSPADPNQPGAARYDGPALTSLELVDYPENILSGNALTSLTSLRSLTVHYKYAREGKERRLGSWLEPLHQLETLTIIDPEV
uniref:F-box domain-containing protein n=1 Tax=Mastacembelus armatus TaxID=205130 RepID=A0A3Q3KHJ0_9TELE